MLTNRKQAHLNSSKSLTYSHTEREKNESVVSTDLEQSGNLVLGCDVSSEVSKQAKPVSGKQTNKRADNHQSSSKLHWQ